ncbi:MAG: hypothetical protein R2856_39445 [Caldilineaceae bacterium]
MLSLIPIRPDVATERAEDVAASVRRGLAELRLQQQIKPGMSVAIAVGSRGSRRSAMWWALPWKKC